MILLIALFILLRPTDGGNHPRKEMSIEHINKPYRFHPPKEWDK